MVALTYLHWRKFRARGAISTYGRFWPIAVVDIQELRAPFCRMMKIEKTCPVVTRKMDRGIEVLAFTHPSAGNQFVKGTIENGEHPQDAAARELREESGLLAPSAMTALGSRAIGPDHVVWHFFVWHSSGLPDSWYHNAEDDHGHTFSFFWHPLRLPLNDYWHPTFHQAFEFITLRLHSS